MITNNDNKDRGVDATELPTDEYPVLREADLLLAQTAAAELNGTDHAPAEPIKAATSLTNLESEVSRLHDKWASMAAEFEKREAQIKHLHEQIETRDVTIATLSADLKRMASKDADIAAMAAEQRARDERIAALAKELAEAETAHKGTLERAERAEAEAARLDGLLRQEQAAMAGTAARHREMLAEQHALQGKLQDLETYINGRHDRWLALNSELAAHKSSLLDMERTVEARDALIAHDHEEKRRLEASIRDLERQCSWLAGRRKEREEANDELQKKLAAHFAQTEQLKAEHTARAKELELAVSEGTTAKAALERRVDELEKASSEHAREQQARHEQLAGERDAAQAESARIRAELGTLTAHASELGMLRSEAVAEAERLKLELAARQELVARLETDLHAKQATAEMLDRSVDRIAGLGARLAALDQQMNGGGVDTQGEHSVAELLPIDLLLDDEPKRNVVSIGERTKIHPGRKLVVMIDGQAFDYPISKKQMTIGRGHDSDIRIASHFVSRVHARIRTSDTATIIEDAGSKNGVVVNSERVLRRVLNNGDLVTLGDHASLRFVDATH